MSAMGIPSAARKKVVLAGGRTVDGVNVSTGNPHFVIAVDNAEFSVAGSPWQEIGAQICVHPDFPHQTNVEFLRIVSPSEIEIRIFERGVGPTTSSGTGTSASATAAIAFHSCKSPLRVVAPGGAQTVSWHGAGSELELTGPATLIARGEAWCG
jgi:diaminopimelate epimerase